LINGKFIKKMSNSANTIKMASTMNKLPSVTEVVAEEIICLSTASHSTISSNETAEAKSQSGEVVNTLSPETSVVLAMHDMILQQQKHLEELAVKNQMYRDRLAITKNQILLQSKDSIETLAKLRFERESFEAEALWLREELRILRNGHIPTTKNVRSSLKKPSPKNLQVEKSGRSATSEVRWARSTKLPFSDKKVGKEVEEFDFKNHGSEYSTKDASSCQFVVGKSPRIECAIAKGSDEEEENDSLFQFIDDEIKEEDGGDIGGISTAYTRPSPPKRECGESRSGNGAPVSPSSGRFSEIRRFMEEREANNDDNSRHREEEASQRVSFEESPSGSESLARPSLQVAIEETHFDVCISPLTPPKSPSILDPRLSEDTNIKVEAKAGGNPDSDIEKVSRVVDFFRRESPTNKAQQEPARESLANECNSSKSPGNEGSSSKPSKLPKSLDPVWGKARQFLNKRDGLLREDSFSSSSSSYLKSTREGALKLRVSFDATPQSAAITTNQDAISKETERLDAQAELRWARAQKRVIEMIRQDILSKDPEAFAKIQRGPLAKVDLSKLDLSNMNEIHKRVADLRMVLVKMKLAEAEEREAKMVKSDSSNGSEGISSLKTEHGGEDIREGTSDETEGGSQMHHNIQKEPQRESIHQVDSLGMDSI
jgi:hypothetical protein